MCHVCPIDFVCKERKIIIIIILTKTIVFTMVMVKPNNNTDKTIVMVKPNDMNLCLLV